MRRIAIICSLTFMCLAAGASALGQTAPAAKSCPFSIVGTWRQEAAATSPVFYRFAPDGTVTLLSRSEDVPGADFEVVAAVNYKLDKPGAPTRLEIVAPRGNQVFARGTTAMDVVGFDDESFTTAHVMTGVQTRWVRAQAVRYFLTFAARAGDFQHGGPAFAMWTRMDGHKTKTETLGLNIHKDAAGRFVPVLDTMPQAVVDEFARETRKDSDVMMRLELTEAEFERTYKVFKTWAKRVQDKTLLYDDPYLNAMEFIRRAAEALNQCGEKVRLHKLTWSQFDQVVSKHNLPQHPLEYIRVMRVNNEKLHVTDAKFPTGWRPTLL